MALFQRHLTAFEIVLLGLVALTSGACAQSAAAAPKEPLVTFRTIAVGNTDAVAGLLYENKGKSVPLLASSTGLSMTYPVPLDGAISLYRESPPVPPDKKPIRVPVASAQFGKKGPYLLALTAITDPNSPDTRKVVPLVIDESWQVHPMENIRVFNFSRHRAAVRIGSDIFELAPAESHVTPFSTGEGSINFMVALQENGRWVRRFNSPQGIIPNTRILIIITNIEPNTEDPHPEGIDINTAFDMSPQPAETENGHSK